MSFPVKSWAALALSVFVFGTTAYSQNGFDRRGSDYLKFDILDGDPEVCATRCEVDARCRAWSFSYPNADGTVAVCWLKNRVPPRVEDKCCVSGVRGAGVIEPRVGAIEYFMDRYGGDYRSFEVAPDPAGAPCKTACEAESKCRAWTYVRPGYIAPPARCYLKERITRPQRKPCCISGVVR
jgi:hypothetical protein